MAGKKRRGKIAIITPALYGGGMERVAANISRILSKHFEIYMIVFNGDMIEYNFDGYIINFGIDLYNKKNILNRTINLMKAIFKLQKIKKMYGFKYTISMGELANIPNILSGGRRNFLTIHENKFSAKKKFYSFLLNNVIIPIFYNLPSVYKVVFVSNGIREEFISRNLIKVNKSSVIYNPFDIQSIKILSNEDLGQYLTLFKNNHILINVSRLSFPKGQWHLLRIFKKLLDIYDINSKGKSIKLVFIGDGELRDDLLNYAKGLGLKVYDIWSGIPYDLDYDVYFIGRKKNPFKFMKQSFAFISTSLWEGLPSVVIEALALEVLVIHSNCKSGPKEILDPLDKGIYWSKDIIIGEYGILMPSFQNDDDKDLISIKDRKWVVFLNYLLLNGQDIIDSIKNNASLRANDFAFTIIEKRWLDLMKK